jgi:hypothetical protein
MNHPTALLRKTTTTIIASLDRRLADKIRFVVGVAITLGGAAVLLLHLVSLAHSI